MRILVLTDRYVPSRAACAVRMGVLVSVLREANHDVTVLASDESLSEGRQTTINRDDICYFHTSPLGDKSALRRLQNGLRSYLSAVAVAHKLPKFDLILCTSPPLLLVLAALRIARRGDMPLILDVRDIWPEIAYEMGSFTRTSVYGRVFERISALAYRRAELVTTVSPGKIEKLLEKPDLVGSNKVRLVQNGLDLGFLDQQESPEVLARYNVRSKKTCVYAGNMGLAQGLDVVLGTAKLYPDVQFLLCGDGADKEQLLLEVQNAKLKNVVFTGILTSQEIYSLLKHATLAFVPLVSSRLRDSVPTKLFEALGCGCPVLLCAQGDAAEIVERSGLGVVVSPEDKEAVHRAFGQLVAYEWDDAIRKRAVALIRTDYSRQDAARQLVQIIDERWGVNAE